MIDVAVVGSLHLDIMVAAPRLPRRDETLIGSSWHTKCGGKGGNQAVAAARFGARTAFGGQTGADDFGERLRANLVAAGVDVSCLGADPSRGSGMSVAISEAAGEYGAVVVSGANLTIDSQVIASHWEKLWNATVLLLQNEVPETVNILAAKKAREHGARVILNAAPARTMSDEFLSLVDVLIVNRVEASMLSGEDDAARSLAILHRSSRDVVLTRGGDGLMLMTRAGQRTDIPALPVKLVSSHGAGDCFCGAFTTRLAAGEDLVTACRFSGVAAGLFVSTPEAHQQLLDAAAVEAAMA